MLDNRKEWIERACVQQRDSMFRYAARRIQNPDDAEDIVSKAIIVALSRINSYRIECGERGVRGWLFGILARCMMKHMYSPTMDQSASVASEPDVWDQIQDEDGKEKIALAHEARYRMQYTNLNDTERRAILLRINNVRRPQAARIMGIKEATFKQAFRRGMQKLRACPITEIPAPTDADYIFWYCSQVTVYRAPQNVGTAVSRENLRSLGAMDRNAARSHRKARRETPD